MLLIKISQASLFVLELFLQYLFRYSLEMGRAKKHLLLLISRYPRDQLDWRNEAFELNIKFH